jgi:hypothetical protein
MSKRRVSGILYDLRELPLPRRSVTFELLASSYTPGRFYVKSSFTAETDDSGLLDVELWASGEGDAAAAVRVQISGAESFTFALPAGATALSWPEVRALGVPAASPQGQTVIEFIENNPALKGADAPQRVFIQQTQPTEPGPWVWYKPLADGGLELYRDDGVI